MLEEHQGGAAGPDRAPEGWVRTYGGRPQIPTHSTPCGGSGARFAGIWDLGGYVLGSWVLPCIPTLYTHPVPIPHPVVHR